MLILVRMHQPVLEKPILLLSIKLTASQLDHTCAKIENDPNSSLYVITQEKKEAFYLQITYTVQ